MIAHSDPAIEPQWHPMVIEQIIENSLSVVNVSENRAPAKESSSEPHASNLSEDMARDHWTKTR